MTRLKVATFNCEWRRTSSSDGCLIRERVFADGPDVICLTETQRDFLDGVGHTIASEQFDTGGKAARRKVLLWSPNPWTAVDTVGPDDLPPGRYAAATTDTPLGELRVIGVVIPYRFAGVRYGEPKRRSWELHLEYLASLGRSLPERPERTLMVGDFNQRIPRKYQPQPIFDGLHEAVLRRFEIATGGNVEPAQQQAIDHICYTSDLACHRAASITNARPGGGKISDHFGVRAEFGMAAKK